MHCGKHKGAVDFLESGRPRVCQAPATGLVIGHVFCSQRVRVEDTKDGRWNQVGKAEPEESGAFAFPLNHRASGGFFDYSQNVPSDVELDLRLAWKPSKHWEVALVGLDLLDDSHFEYPWGLSPVQSEVPRSVYGKVTWRF
jgi:hypothetical protein